MNKSLFSLEEKTILVTGSTQGIGLALARGLMENGARVILNGRSPEKTEAAAAECRAAGFRVEAAAFDVTSEGAVRNGVARILSQVGSLDVVILNAGTGVRGPVADMSYDDWKRVLSLNLDGAFLVAREVIPGMVERKQGKIITICSLMSSIARTDNANYAASKGGLAMFTKELAVELGPHNIQANGIAPGYYETPLTSVLLSRPEFREWLEKRTPMGRWGQPEELVGTAVYLASRASDFVSGQILYVDGGFTAAM